MPRPTDSAPTPDPAADPAGPRRSGDTRERLIRAGWHVYDEVPLAKVFAGATASNVAESAGVTTGSFFHHFANAAEFTDALALSSEQIPNDFTEAVDELVDSLQHIDLLQVIRSSVTDTWRVYVADDEIGRRLRAQMTLWSHHNQPLSRPRGDATTVGDILREGYANRRAAAVAGWSHLLEQAGRTVIEPFTIERVIIAMTALLEGLLVLHQVEPDAVDDELYGDVAAAIATALTVPRGSRVRLADLGTPLVDQSRLSPQARSGARRRRETRARIRLAASGLFTNGWEDVPASEVAEAAGVSNQTVVNLFHGVQGVAAATFAEHATDVREVADSTADQDPLLALHQVLVRLAECVAMDPEPARALLAERVAAALHQGGELSDVDIRLEVPLADSVMLPLSRLDVGDAEPIEIATVLINFVLSHAIGRSGQEFETARLALRLLPDAATGTHWSHPIGPDRRVAPDRRSARHDGRSREPGWQLTDPTGPY